MCLTQHPVAKSSMPGKCNSMVTFFQNSLSASNSMQLSQSVPLKSYFSDLNQTLMGLLGFCKRILDVRKNVFQVVNIKVGKRKAAV